MLQYFTSHGASEPAGGLSLLGREQVSLLAKHLKSLSFQGLVIHSPDAPSRESASFLADATGSERVCLDGFSPEGEGTLFGRIAREYSKNLSLFHEKEVLFVTGTAVCEALIRLFELKIREGEPQYHCALSSLDPLRWKTAPVVRDFSFLPPEKRSLDPSCGEFDPSPAEDTRGDGLDFDLSDFEGERILHIGDTESGTYPYYRELIRHVAPQIILHTGDLADEVKMARQPERLEEYCHKVKILLSILRESGARVILVVGNHDVESVLRTLAPDMEVYLPGEEISLSGIPCRLGHQVREMVFDRKYSFYGHGMAGEAWRHGMNQPGGPFRFSAAFGSFVLDLKKEKFLRLPRYYCK